MKNIKLVASVFAACALVQVAISNQTFLRFLLVFTIKKSEANQQLILGMEKRRDAHGRNCKSSSSSRVSSSFKDPICSPLSSSYCFLFNPSACKNPVYDNLI